MLLNDGEKVPDKPRKPSSLFEDFKEFTTETTSHGVKYVFHAAYQWVRLIYLVLWLSAVAYTMYIVVLSVTKYLSMETGTKIEELVTPREEFLNQPAITHPTVTVCPHNIVSRAYLNENPHLEELFGILHGWEKEEADAISFEDGKFAPYRNMTYHDVMWHGRPRLGLLQCEHYRFLCQDIQPFADDEYETKEYHWDKTYNGSHHKHYEWEVSLSGSCYRINPKGSIYTQSGDYGVLKLFFFADLNDYSSFAKRLPQYGYTVTFTDNGTYSATMTSGFYMSPGNVYKADLRKYKESNIGPPAGSCNPHHKNNVYGTYSTNSCTAKCRDDYVLKRCKCVQILPPHPENEPDGDKYKACTLEQWVRCGAEAHKNFTDEFVDLYTNKQMCDCHAACMEIWYEATISSSRLSKYYAENRRDAVLPRVALHLNRDDGVENYTETTETVYENLMVLSVLFTSIQESNYKEYVKYDYTALIGDVGGQMGMLLGASLFTIIEFIHFFIKSFWRYCVRKAPPTTPQYEMHTDNF